MEQLCESSFNKPLGTNFLNDPFEKKFPLFVRLSKITVKANFTFNTVSCKLLEEVVMFVVNRRLKWKDLVRLIWFYFQGLSFFLLHRFDRTFYNTNIELVFVCTYAICNTGCLLFKIELVVEIADMNLILPVWLE